MNNAIFYSCSGKLLNIQSTSFSFTCENCNFDSLLVLNNIQTNSNNCFHSAELIYMNINCYNEHNNNNSCNNKSNKIKIMKSFLFIYTLKK